MDGTIKQLDEYIFFKLHYYGTKYTDIKNECSNFFVEERKKFKENNYDESIIILSLVNVHDSYAIFKYKDDILRITYDPGCYEKIFEFYGVKNWEEKEFMKRKPTIIIDELYEELPGIFVYNTLWYHEDMEGENHSELSIKFTKLIHVK